MKKQAGFTFTELLLVIIIFLIMFFRAGDSLPERGKTVILQYVKRGKPAVTTAFCTENDRWIDTRIQRDITDSLTSETFWCDFHDDEE